jgi:hypothetical protein
MEPQSVHCPGCQALVPAADINIAALVAKCGNCNRIFPLSIENLQAEGAAKPEPELGCPGGVVREIGPGGELFIRLSWFQPVLIFMAFFCVFWDGFLVFWYTTALAHPAPGKIMWLPILFPLLHVAVGVGLTYYVIAGFLNSTRILIDDEFVHIRHQPLPWRGNRDQPRGEIRGIEMTVGWAQNQQPMFSVCANGNEGRQTVLLSNISYNHARYLARQMADFLGVGFIGCEPNTFAFPLPRWLRGRRTG